jgi:hypothetical protein
VADHRHRAALEGGQPGDDRRVVAVGAVAVDLDPVLHQPLDVVQRVGALGVARHQRLLPPREIPVDVGGLLAQRRLEALEIALVALGESLELLDLPAQLGQRLLEGGARDVGGTGGRHRFGQASRPRRRGSIADVDSTRSYRSCCGSTSITSS